jgi:hypothetical protein
MDYLVDTNVPIMANRDQSPQALIACQEACVDLIERLINGEFRLVIDMDWIVIEEYSHKLHPNNAGLGDRFYSGC